MKPKFSICIPTYNRANFLTECLDSVLPQVTKKEQVEVIVIDNASTDVTHRHVEKFMESYDCIQYYRNEKNLGYAGNQVKCIEHASGEYMALLCDDDIYTDGQIARILNVISKREYAFVALNYYSFLKKANKPYKSNYAPEKDVTFKRAYDILNYPSVGHFSGFVINLNLAKEALAKILRRKNYEYFEKMRGIIFDVAVRSTIATDLPAYFIGFRGLANRIPINVDYDNLYHQCIDYYEYFDNLYNNGLITKEDLEYRSMLVLGRLPRAIISTGSKWSKEEMNKIKKKFSIWYKRNRRFNLICLPLLIIVKYRFIKILFQILTNLFRYSKSIRYHLAS